MSASLRSRPESRARFSPSKTRTKHRPTDVTHTVNITPENYHTTTPSLGSAEPIRVVWTIKTALHGDILPVDGLARGDGWFTPKGNAPALRIGKDCFLTRDEAHNVAILKRQSRIKNLEKQIKRLKDLLATAD